MDTNANHSADSAAPEGVERHGFGAEVGRLLDLVVHSLYSDREIFLRELVANAADAIDRRRFLALTDPTLAPAASARIVVAPDKAARTIRIDDDGIGMTREELIDHLGTIARSGTRAFGQSLEAAKAEDRPALIGQFGVGFYSAFMVADRVEVTSRRAGTDEAHIWASDGLGEFTIAPAERTEPGTTVLLHIRADADEFLDPVRLETIIRKWADHITVPIVLIRDGQEQPANEGTALWRRAKAEVSAEDYEGFYRHLGHYFDKPWATLHWRAEGTLEYYALLFIPTMKPFDAIEQVRESRVRLHVRRMFITNEAGLLPPWLRFVDGVVDTEDLPLNVSREMLQATPVLARIRKAVTNRVLTELKTRAKDAEDYAKFWDNFGAVIKEGIWEDAEYRTDIAGLLRFHSTAADTGLVSLDDYVGRMATDQDTIWYLAGDDEAALRASPQVEGFRARGVEVLLLTDPIDAFWPERLTTYAGKTLRSVTQAPADKAADQAASDGASKSVRNLVAAIKTALGDVVADVRTTSRLTDSAVVLAAGTAGPDLQMQRLLRRTGRAIPTPPPVLEINPTHPAIRRLAEQAEADPSRVAAASSVLLDLARVQDGEPPRDPASFARAITALLAGEPTPSPDVAA